MDKVLENLANDYLLNADNSLWAAKKICEVVPENTVERMFKAEDPLYFLMGHAAELVLKAALVYKEFDESSLKKNELRHDLNALLNKNKENHIRIDNDFEVFVDAIAENFKDHDFRYARIFSGFPEEKHEELLASIRGGKNKKELKKYGLAVKSKVNVEKSLQAIENQIQLIAKQKREAA